MSRLIRPVVAALLLAVTAAGGAAQPVVLPISVEAAPSSACRLRVGPSPDAQSWLVFRWADMQGTMHVNGQSIALTAKEAACGTDCVAPGRAGMRVFHFRARGVSATFRKHVSCHQAAESCGGVPEGPALLTVSTARGELHLDVWNDFCDI